ncbi:MAG: hypothetical protein GY844_22800 [Bradyrhizobium sp.]|jgi:hypothetical protein|uniref:Uncharacterized protein n=4 Tax=Hyphomicrobiales TaxID=356 RepID=A0A1C2DCW8_9HYPH|nr:MULTISPECIES: hypothetical protein [Alphaproteobacteria]MBN8942729.1 hypothetical protein [Hyphomicrobiales bacterium]MCP4619253.1 hypothetical protein [Bradyrhizobium sp.]MBN9232989.1 hypothetical protein [Mesorhizobium sp.]MBR1134189.1 hypothetical protein [Bradyrhizobium denitrificans]MBX9992057.1 hypothetical protein [Phreatobacter oligotrophus]
MRIVLRQAEKPDWSQDASGFSSAFEVGASLELAGVADKFTVAKWTIVVDADGDARLEVTLKSTRRWFTWLDERARTKDILYPLAGFAMFAVLILPCAAPFWFFSLNAELRIAWGGYLIAHALWPIIIGVILAVQIVAGRAERHVGKALGFGISMAGVPLGVAIALLWRWLFLPDTEPEWPAGYARLARSFWESTGAMSAVALAYAPLATALIKWDWVAVLTSLLTRKKAA